MTLLGLTGYAQVGKDTVADILVTQHGFTKAALADPLRSLLYKTNPWIIPRTPDSSVEFKQFPTGRWRLADVVDAVGWDAAKQLPEVRKLLQDLGLACRDIFGPEVWIDALLREHGEEERLVVSDIRFDNEVAFIRRYKGAVVQITRPGYGPVNDHISDQGVGLEATDWFLTNDGTIEELGIKVGGLLAVIENPLLAM